MVRISIPFIKDEAKKQGYSMSQATLDVLLQTVMDGVTLEELELLLDGLEYSGAITPAMRSHVLARERGGDTPNESPRLPS